MPINQPSGQIKLTNVSIVRLKKGGKRFEIACYKNKVQEWRSGVETDLDNVLQIANVFVNVSKGEAAKSQDLAKVFGTADVDTIVKEILKKGELQVGEKERDQELSNIRKEVATLIAEKCVDPATQKPLPVSLIEKAMNEAGFSVKPHRTAKSQVSECIKLIQTKSKLPIERGKMRIRVTMPSKDAKKLKEKVVEGADKVERDEISEDGEGWEAVLTIDPGRFHAISELLQKECKAGRVEIMEFNTATAENAIATA